jgi:DNA repair exonuclease SbcCD nuclease subunit
MNNKADAIFIADLHLRLDTPVCRTDNFEQTQWGKLDFISNLQKKNNCPVICSGDLLHVWKASPELLSKIIEHLPKDFFTVIGNHDLPSHNLELLYKSGVYTLSVGDHLNILKGTHWNQEPDPNCFFEIKNKKILVWHTMTWKDVLPYYGCTSITAKAILKRFPEYSTIITGDNHQTFVEEYKGRILVNPGSITRQSAKQIDHKPCVFLWYAETNTVEQVFLPIEEGVISREHIEIEEKRNERIDAFISGLNINWEHGVSFKANLLKFYEKNKVEKDIKELVQKFIEE